MKNVILSAIAVGVSAFLLLSFTPDGDQKGKKGGNKGKSEVKIDNGSNKIKIKSKKDGMHISVKDKDKHGKHGNHDDHGKHYDKSYAGKKGKGKNGHRKNRHYKYHGKGKHKYRTCKGHSGVVIHIGHATGQERAVQARNKHHDHWKDKPEKERDEYLKITLARNLALVVEIGDKITLARERNKEEYEAGAISEDDYNRNESFIDLSAKRKLSLEVKVSI